MSESLLDQAPIGIAVLGANGYFVTTYARLNEFITPERHRTIFDITPRHLHARLRQQLMSVKRTGETISSQIPLMDKERNLRWVQLTIENGSNYRLIAYLTPIDQQKSLQEMVLRLGSDPINLNDTAKEVAGSLNSDAVCIANKNGAVATFWKDGGIRNNFTYEIAMTPCASVLRKKDIVYIPTHVQRLYPEAVSLRKMDINGYFGMPIMEKGNAIGVLSIMSRDVLIIDDLHVAILRLFAMRAASVLRYNIEDSEIRHELETHG